EHDQNNRGEDSKECTDDHTALTKPNRENVPSRRVICVFLRARVQVSIDHGLEPQFPRVVLMDWTCIHTHRRRRYEALNFGESVFRHIQKIAGLQVSVLFQVGFLKHFLQVQPFDLHPAVWHAMEKQHLGVLRRVSKPPGDGYRLRYAGVISQIELSRVSDLASYDKVGLFKILQLDVYYRIVQDSAVGYPQ